MIALPVPKARVAHFVGLTRRALYPDPHEPTPRQRPDKEGLCRAVRRVAFEHITFGYRRVHSVLRQEGWEVNRKRVHRILQKEKLLKEAHYPRPRVPESGSLAAARPNERWYMDITYLETTDGGRAPWCWPRTPAHGRSWGTGSPRPAAPWRRPTWWMPRC
jgi:hypothetical protein